MTRAGAEGISSMASKKPKTPKRRGNVFFDIVEKYSDDRWIDEAKHRAPYPPLRPPSAAAPKGANPDVDGWTNLKPDVGRLAAVPGYETLAAVHDAALHQAQAGKGAERHASGEPFEDQPIVAVCENLGSPQFAIGQAHKKSRESLRLPYERARAELLGAMNYLAAAVIVLDRGARAHIGRGDPTLAHDRKSSGK